MAKRPAPHTGLLALIMLNLQPQTQLVSLWKAVENLDDSHAAGMVRLFPLTNRCHSDPERSEGEESAVRLHRHGRRLVLLISALEVRDLVIAFKVPHTRGHFVDQVMVVGDEEYRPLIPL
jgi:hypothetical protein